MARRLGLDPGTVAVWEGGEVRRPYPRIRRAFERTSSQGYKYSPSPTALSTHRPKVLTYAMFTLSCRAVQDGAGGGGATVASRGGFG